MRRACIVMSVLTLALTALPGVASARNSYTERWHDEGEQFIDFCPFADDLILTRWDIDGSLSIVERNGELAYFTEAVRATIVWTNTATGKALTNTFATVFHDLEVVDNGDGTLTIIAQGTGSDLYFSGRRLVLTNNGNVRFEVIVDHGGTPGDPFDDEFVSGSIVRPSTGTNDTDGRDFCEDVLFFTS